MSHSQSVKSILIAAAESGNLGSVQHAVRRGISETDMRKALMTSAFYGNAEVVDFLLTCISPDSGDCHVFESSAYSGNLSLVKRLVSRSAKKLGVYLKIIKKVSSF